ncbi:MAG: hypothetical protein ACFCD0_22420 [Gemmataceae bacterium]
MKLEHTELVDLLRLAYSAEKAAAFAYIGHAGSLKKKPEAKRVNEIEQDEWNHRDQVKRIMDEYGIEPSRYYEMKYHLLGKLIGLSCYFIGRFMPYFFAGRLESGNVCEYFRMMHYFHSLGITKHDDVLYEMGIKEKEHEVYFLNMVKDESWLPIFERIFAWGPTKSTNDVDLEEKLSIMESHKYCRT